MMIVYRVCPCCNGEDIQKAIAAKDHTVSGEIFEIWECNACTLRFTQSIPDKNNIEIFYRSETYISHSDTKKGVINSVYHYVRKRTLKSKRNLIENYAKLPSGRILDMGAGTGAFLHTMQSSQWEVTGLEPDDIARENANKLYGLSLKPPEELFNLQPASFNAITLWHVLEHIHDLHLYIGQLKKVLKPTGFLFVAVPNYTCYDEKIYKEFWAGYDVPRHLYHFSPASITQLLLKHGLQLKEIKPMWYDSFYVSMLSEKYKNGKNNFLSAMWNGYISNCKALFNTERCSSVIYIVTH